MKNQVVAEDLERIVASDLPWSVFEGRTVLITGANGFLPAYMLETLLYLNEASHKHRAQRTKVIGLVRNRAKAMSRLSYYQDRDDLQLIEQDVCEPISINGKIDYIIHAASQASPRVYSVDPVGTLAANILGTGNLLNLAMTKETAGFLFFSTSEVYGTVDPTHIPIKENTYGWIDPTDVRSCYAESKRMGETMCVSWFHQYAVPAKIVRPFHTFGPGMKLDDGRVFADFVADILANRDILLKTDGSASRAFCYLADATIGFFTILLKGKTGEAYNIGNDKGEMRILELARMLAGLFSEKGLKGTRQESTIQQACLKSTISRSCPDISKARELGWQPITSVRDGFTRTIRSFE
jgi:nucleoside-diphosphate-sugar epimerase